MRRLGGASDDLSSEREVDVERDGEALPHNTLKPLVHVSIGLHGDRTREARQRRAAQVAFSTAWAFIILADRTPWGSLPEIGVSLTTSILAVIALVVIARPDRVVLLCVLLAAHLASTASTWGPGVTIHGYAAAVLEATVLVVVALHALGVSSLRERGMAERSLVGPALFFVSASMGAAGFAKLNHDFLDPASSCGPVLYLWLRESALFAWLPNGEWVAPLIIAWTLVAELGGALLLLTRRTRIVGLALLVSVWLPIALIPRFTVVEFTGVFFSASLLFVPRDALASGVSRFHSLWRRVSRRAPRRAVASLRAIAISAWIVAVFGEHVGFDVDVRKTICRMVCTTGALMVVWLLLMGGRHRWTFPRVRPPSRAALAAWSFVALLLVNEASPYFGLWQNVSMTMAGNFWVQPAFSNHVVFSHVPTWRSTRPIAIVASNDAAFPVDAQMPWILFKELAARHRAADVTYRDGTKTRHLKPRPPSAHEPGSLAARMLSLRARVPPRSGVVMCNKEPPGVDIRAWYGREREIADRRAAP